MLYWNKLTSFVIVFLSVSTDCDKLCITVLWLVIVNVALLSRRSPDSVNHRCRSDSAFLKFKLSAIVHCFSSGVSNTRTACGPRGHFVRPAMFF